MASVRARGCRFVVGGLVSLLTAAALQAAEYTYPGTIPGNFAVSDQGVAQYLCREPLDAISLEVINT